MANQNFSGIRDLQDVKEQLASMQRRVDALERNQNLELVQDKWYATGTVTSGVIELIQGPINVVTHPGHPIGKSTRYLAMAYTLQPDRSTSVRLSLVDKAQDVVIGNPILIQLPRITGSNTGYLTLPSTLVLEPNSIYGVTITAPGVLNLEGQVDLIGVRA